MTELATPLVWAPSLTVRAGVWLKTFVVCCGTALIGLEVWAALTGYGLRVTSDTPTFLPIVQDLAVHPLRSVSPFLNDPHVETSHATPYTQLLGLIWARLAPHRDAAGAPTADPGALYGFLCVVGIVVTLLVLHAVFVWARSQAGSRTAWLTLPVLLVMFGPAQVIWAGDLTFHGFLYGSYFPQNVALALLCYGLAALERPPSGKRTALATICIAAAFTVHPFTGALLAALVAGRGCILAARRSRDWLTGSVAISLGFAASLLWPVYSVNHALVDVGLKGWIFVVACALAPAVAHRFERSERAIQVPGRFAVAIENPRRYRSIAAAGLALFGLTSVVALTAWEALLVRAGSSDALIHTNRLAVYWVEDRWRWPLMLAGGVIGILGLAWLARRKSTVPAAWFLACLALGIAGAIGAPVPVWWRFLLFAQVPLALGTAHVLARLERRSLAHGAVVATLLVLLAVKVGSLFFLPGQNTYFGTDLQTTYDFSRIIPTAPGLVATDPFTAYYVPGATGHRVLSVTKAHVNSQRELTDSERGYALLHQLYAGQGWWSAAQRMYRDGVRYVVIAKQTSLAPRTLADFSTGPTPLIRTVSDRRELGRYFYRCNRFATVRFDSSEYVVYQIDHDRLFGTRRVASIPSLPVGVTVDRSGP